jgi:chromosome segregation ATPase
MVEEANKRLSQKSAEVDELRVVHAAVREEAAQAREAEAKAREDVARAREEATKAREDLAPLLARVKELEEDVALVSGQRDALNIQIGMASAHVGTLEDEVATLKGTVRERDDALSGTGQKIETLGQRSVTRTRLFRRRRRRARSCATRLWVGRPTLRVNLLSCFDLGLEVSGLC